MLTKFCPFLNTYLPLVDICEGIPLLLQGIICIPLTFPGPPTHLILSTQFVKTPYYMAERRRVIIGRGRQGLEKIFGRKQIARQIGHSCLIVYIIQIMSDQGREGRVEGATAMGIQFKGDVIQISLSYVVGTLMIGQRSDFVVRLPEEMWQEILTSLKDTIYHARANSC